MKNNQNLKLKTAENSSIFYFIISKLYAGILLSTFYFLFSSSAWAVVLYLEPPEEDYHKGDTFVVEVRIDTEAECINAVDINLSFSQDILKAVDFSKGDSILTLWIKEPVLDQSLGLISFSGGIPGGYCGILPGEPGKPNLLGRIILKAQEIKDLEGKQAPYGTGKQQAKINFLDTSQVLLNDGLGTSAELATKGAIFTILPEKAEVPKDKWLQELEKDNIPPESFEIEIHQDSAIFEGKYFIIFSTTDKQTGTDYYEIKEGDRDWQRIKSPHLLEDQTLQSVIKVRAVDKAGNERIAEYLPLKEPFPWWIIILIIVGMGIIWWTVKNVKRKTKNAKQ